MGRLIELDDNEIESIADMLREYRSAVADGSISGFGQPVEDELSDTDALISKLDRVRSL